MAVDTAPWTTSNGCPADCDRTYSSGHLGGWSSDHNGRCRHGTYVAGSGIDYMCGACEMGDELEVEYEGPCSMCGSTSTREISDDHQTITVCGVCGSDQD